MSMAVLTLLAAPGAARACKLPGPLPGWRAELSPGPPGRITSLTAELTRGDPGSFTERNCGANARLDLAVAGTAESEVSYQVLLVDGALPPGFELPRFRVLRDAGHHIQLHWPDLDPLPATIDFTLEVTPVNAFGASGEGARVHVHRRGRFHDMVLVLLLWPIALFVRFAADRLPLDYHTVTLEGGATTRPEREWFVAPGRLRLAHHRAALALHLLAVTALAYALLWCLGRFGVVALAGVAVLLQLHSYVAVRVHRTPLPPGRWLLERLVRARVRRAGPPQSIEATLGSPAGTRVCVRGRVRARGGADAIYRRLDEHDGLSREVIEWLEPFELVDERGLRLAIDVSRAWMVGRRALVVAGDEVTVVGRLERRKLGVGHGGDPFRGDVEACTLVAPAGEALLVH